MNNKLFYTTEACCFEEALPIGNGRMGAMVYGRVKNEKLSLNEDTLWSGTGKRNPVPENAFESYKKAQNLILEDKILEAQTELAANFHSMWSQMYMPLGNLYLNFDHHDVSDYKRCLDISTGLCEISYLYNNVKYKREIFASNPDDVIVLKFSSDKDNMLNFSFDYKTELKAISHEFKNNTYVTTGICPSNGCNYPHVQKEPVIYTSEKGIEFTFAIKVDCDGSVFDCGNCIKIESATVAVIYISIKTSFNGFDKSPGTEGLEHYNSALNVINKLNLSDYNDILNNHTNDFSSLYNRVEFNLGASDNEKDTLSRLENFDGNDSGLYELLFGYGRYLTISASRRGTQATNLQGIWNEHIAPPWSSNYTININTEMNYWPTLNTNLLECYEPFVSLAKKLHKTGQLTARDYYNARGFVSHHNTDLWGMSNPVGYLRDYNSCVYSFWNMSSGWIACQLFDLYEYTLDINALKDIFPIIQDSVLFYSDIMYKDSEGYMICPSTSPENSFVRAECDSLSVSKTTTMTTSILKELFTRYLKASDILGIENEITKKASDILKNLYPVKITSDGRIMEWADEEIESEINHRHVSHLYSLYPGNMITVKKTPELAEACKQSLLVRGDDGTGWSLGWKINLWAYLKDGNHALKLINRQLKLVRPAPEIIYMAGGGTYPNMFDAHPPFQIDGNFGSTAAICNMLMQSEIGYIEILPALPDSWRNGSISGIIAKGNIELDFSWKENTVVHLVLKSKLSQNVEISVNKKIFKVSLSANEEYTLI